MVGRWHPTAQDTAVGRTPGFGMTVDIINGGVECSQPTPRQVEDRVAFYRRFTGLLSVDPGAALYCDRMAHF
jgi:chitinase